MMTKEEKLYEVYGGRYDWNENGWLLYGCDEEKESGFEPFGEYETRNHIDGYYEWRPIELRGIENNNGWIKIESESDLPTEDVEYKVGTMVGNKFHLSTGVYDVNEVKFSYQNKYITHYQPIVKPQPPIY